MKGTLHNLWDMLEAAKTVLEFTQNVTFYHYQQDKKLKLAVERSIEIIGEAASRVSKAFRGTSRDFLARNHWTAKCPHS